MVSWIKHIDIFVMRFLSETLLDQLPEELSPGEVLGPITELRHRAMKLERQEILRVIIEELAGNEGVFEHVHFEIVLDRSHGLPSLYLQDNSFQAPNGLTEEQSRKITYSIDHLVDTFHFMLDGGNLLFIEKTIASLNTVKWNLKSGRAAIEQLASMCVRSPSDWVGSHIAHAQGQSLDKVIAHPAPSSPSRRM